MPERQSGIPERVQQGFDECRRGLSLTRADDEDEIRVAAEGYGTSTEATGSSEREPLGHTARNLSRRAEARHDAPTQKRCVLSPEPNAIDPTLELGQKYVAVLVDGFTKPHALGEHGGRGRARSKIHLT
jgi:hypothetical protein